MTVDIDEDTARIYADSDAEMRSTVERLMKTYQRPNHATMTCWYPHTTFIYERVADGRMRTAWIVTTLSVDALAQWLEVVPV